MIAGATPKAHIGSRHSSYTGLDDKSEQMTIRNDLLVRAFLDQFQ